jgi:hypothetical protein
MRKLIEAATGNALGGISQSCTLLENVLAAVQCLICKVL